MRSQVTTAVAGAATFVVGVPMLVVLLLGAGVSNPGSCPPTTTTSGIPTGTGDPLSGQLTLAQANIPARSGSDGFAASMPRVLSHDPDFVTLNEQASRGLDTIQAAAPGYTAYRDRNRTFDPGSDQTFDTVVLYRHDTWTQVAGGRVKLVEDDVEPSGHGLATRDRFATWATLARADGTRASIISVHMPINPGRYGPDPARRRELYAHGMDTLIDLITQLSAQGTVLIGGDFNVHADQVAASWTAPAKMRAAGYTWYAQDLDYLFYPASAAVQLLGAWTGSMVSDHPWISVTLHFNTTAVAASVQQPAGDALRGAASDSASDSTSDSASDLISDPAGESPGGTTGGDSSGDTAWSKANHPGGDLVMSPTSTSPVTTSQAVSPTPSPTVNSDDVSGDQQPCPVVTQPGVTGSGHFTPSPVDYVGPFDRTTLLMRMQTIEQANGLPNVDPFFTTQPDGSWYHDCQQFVAILDGRPHSGFGSAASGWASALASGQAHPANNDDGLSPPVGAWLYYGPDHVVVYLGDNLVAGTDTWGTGIAREGPASDIDSGIWHLTYLGWVAPWGAGG